MELSLKGKKILITGAGAGIGIGAAVAVALGVALAVTLGKKSARPRAKDPVKPAPARAVA